MTGVQTCALPIFPAVGSFLVLTLIGLVGSLIVLGLGQLAFKRTEGKFAQEL